MRILTIAAVQTEPVPGDTDATWRQYAAQVRAIRETFPHVQLVLHPELHLSAPGGLLDEAPDYALKAAVELPGPLTEQLGELARETGLWLVPGSVYERGERDTVYNTAVVLSPTGELVTRYRKCFPWQPYETTTPGTELVTFDLPLPDGDSTRVGLAICYDGAFPEVFRQLAWSGAEVVLQPTLTPTRDRELEILFARTNAATNQVFVVSVNAGNAHGVGESLIVDPEGHVRQQALGGTEVLVDALDLDAVTRVRTYGTYGLNRPWTQLDEHGPRMRLPMYGKIHPRPEPTPRPGR
jgi:formamidase